MARRLFPIRRSLTGPGVRETLAVIGEHVPLAVHEVPTGTPVLDWTVPREWVLRDAWVEDLAGRRVIDLADHPLHALGYSTPIDAVVDREELLAHLHGLPDHPDWIPYRTAYYREAWGLCAAQRVIDGLGDPQYRVRIDAELRDGSLTYGELVLPGDTEDEVLLTTHVCHPGMANDNVSGMTVLTAVAAWLGSARRRLTYRVLFLPGTMGSITWLARHAAAMPPIRHGLTIAGIGDHGSHTWKRTEAEDAPIDRAVAVALRDAGEPFELLPFSPWGYDERQFNSPGFRLPVGLLMRTPHGTYPEYHTSADDLAFIDPARLAASVELVRSIVGILERDRIVTSLAPMAEPQLGRRGLYSPVGGATGRAPDQLALLWVLNQADGAHRLVDIAARSGLPFERIADAADALQAAGLLAA
ncbi:MAG: peptidase M28 [Chloroflexi bacterium RBG_16_72_14]|nr:MAG: peptidase M28 [Chloroflexi bacterium RBG_16_72_14]